MSAIIAVLKDFAEGVKEGYYEEETIALLANILRSISLGHNPGDLRQA